MPVRMSVTVLGADTTGAYLDAVRRGIPEESVKGVHAATITLRKELRLHYSGKTIGGPVAGPAANPFAGPSRRNRGGSARAWQVGAPVIRGNDVEGSVGSNHPAAAIHETGGTIRPVHARNLAIPIHPRADRRRPGDFPAEKTAVVKTPRGAFIVLNERRSTLFLYLLKPSVTMPARRPVTRAIRDARPEMESALGRAVDVALRRES